MGTITRHRHGIIETLQLDVGKPAVSQQRISMSRKETRQKTTEKYGKMQPENRDTKVKIVRK